MNCAFDKEKLSAYYDGELAPGEKAEVERHIASCSECLRDLGELKSAALLIKELPRLRAPKSIAEGVTREIQAAGKVHVMARVRRMVLWASAAAAGLFIVANAMYLTNQQKSAEPMAASKPALSGSLARSEPAPENRTAAPAKAGPAEEMEADRALRRQDEQVKRVAAADAKQEAAGAEAQAEAGKKNFNEAAKVEAKKELLAKAEEPKSPSPAPAAPPPLAAKPAPPPAPVVREEAKPLAEMPAEKAAERKADAVAKSDAEQPKAKVAAAAGAAPADLAPLQYSCVTTQLSKARPRLDDQLKKLGVVPIPSPAKAPRNRETENTIVVELTDAQLLKLREELEKPGDLRLVAAAANPVEPVLPGFKPGGLYGNKAASGGTGTKVPSSAPAPAAKDKDGKELEDKNAADPAAAPEPRRRVTLHLVEAKSLPAADVESAPAKKN